MPRAIWNGTISFGLVTVPVGLYRAIEEKTLHFHNLTKSGHRVREKRVDEKTGREVEYASLVKGYEQSRGHYVMIEPDELAAAAPEQTRTIEIEDMVELADIDPISYNTTYYVAPRGGGGADKAYALLREAMEKTGRAAIGRFVLRTKQHLVAIRPDDGALLLQTLYFADEIRSARGLSIPSRTKAGAKELKIATQLIDSLTVDWDPKRYKDTYRAAVEKVVSRKAKGQAIVVEEPEEEPAKVLDLVAALEASLEGKGRRTKSAAKTKKATPRKRARKAS